MKTKNRLFDQFIFSIFLQTLCWGLNSVPDAGSRTIKIVLIDARSLAVIAKGLTDQGVAQDKLTSELFDRLLKDSDIRKKDVRRIVATGYGRNVVSVADTTITEITCHAAGVRRVMPNAMTIIDIGGEDSKLIRLDRSGKVRDFAMNDRCAAGTGRFLEVVARRLGVELPRLGEMAAHSCSPAATSSMCVVFAETEIIGLLAAGTPAEDIVAGVQAAVASRVMSMIGRKAERRGLLSKQISPLRPTDSGPSVEMTYVFVCNFYEQS